MKAKINDDESTYFGIYNFLKTFYPELKVSWDDYWVKAEHESGNELTIYSESNSLLTIRIKKYKKSLRDTLEGKPFLLQLNSALRALENKE